jgi:hypothetical protein
MYIPAGAYQTATRGYDLEDEARGPIGQVVASTQLSYERLVTLYEQVVYVDRLKLAGALVECGVWRGGAAALMAIANMRPGSVPRTLHLFDSFQGMPEPRPERDGQNAIDLLGAPGSSLRSAGVNVASQTDVEALLARVGFPPERVRIYPGWFQDTLRSARLQIGPIALLRLDGDFYDSTRVALESLYDLVIPRGVVVIDDYGHFAGCREATNEFLAAHDPDLYLHHVDYSGRYLIKPPRCA